MATDVNTPNAKQTTAPKVKTERMFLELNLLDAGLICTDRRLTRFEL